MTDLQRPGSIWAPLYTGSAFSARVSFHEPVKQRVEQYVLGGSGCHAVSLADVGKEFECVRGVNLASAK